MTVSDIYTAVRCCIDEEDANASSLANSTTLGSDSTLMNNIIKNKIPAALRWVTLYAPSDALSGGSSGGGGGGGSTTLDIIAEETSGGSGDSEIQISGNTITPRKTLIRVVRVKGSSWSRAILGDSLISEDSDEYLQLSDTHGAAATNDRPQAALVNTKQKKVEVWPHTNNSFTLTYIRALTASEIDNISDSTNVTLPALVETSFIYYLAYLLCCAYGDGRAKSMFEIATMNLGRTDDKQRQ